MMKNSVISSIPHLPEDLIIEFLLRLPVKSLVRFCCVCKFFQCLITSDRSFMRSHLQISLNNDNGNSGGRKNVLLPNLLKGHSDSSQGQSILRELASALGDSPSCRFIFKGGIFFNCEFAGCCDGIICFYDICNDYSTKDSNLMIYLCNPALNQCRVLERRNNKTSWTIGYNRWNTKACFIFDPASNDYKVIMVTISNMNRIYMVEIYSLSNDSWRAFSWGNRSYQLSWKSDIVVHNGFLYWITEHRDGHKEKNILNEFDMSEEKIRKISLPDCSCSWKHLFLLRCEGSLAISGQDIGPSNKLWVMKEDNAKIFWVKKVLHLKPACICGPQSNFCPCFRKCYLCIVPSAPTDWTYFKVYGGNIHWGWDDVENGRRAGEIFLGSEDSLNNTRSINIAAEYVASLVSVAPSPQPIQRNFKQR